MQDQNHGKAPPPAGKPDEENPSVEERRLTPPTPVVQETQEPSEPGEGRRPTPVRAAMEGADEEEKDRNNEARTVHDEEGGLDWIVTVSGRSASGILPLRTVPVVELSFAKAEEPERPLRRVLCSASDLAGIPDHELYSCFKNSEPYREPSQVPVGKGRPEKRGKNRRGG